MPSDGPPESTQDSMNKSQLLIGLSRITPQAAKDLVPPALKARILQTVLPKQEEVEPDTVLISFPKSGRTWLRALIGKVVADRWGHPDEEVLRLPGLGQELGFDVLDWTHDGSSPLEGNPYWELSKDKSAYRGRKVVFLTRDIRDTTVSSFYASRKRDKIYDGDISDFVRSDVLGVKRLLAFNKIWHDNQHVPDAFLHIRYEDMHERPGEILREVLEFINLRGIDQETIDKAVEFARFENLKDLEQASFFRSGALRPKNPDDPESFKVRSGKVGGFSDDLSEADLLYIKEAEKELGNPFA